MENVTPLTAEQAALIERNRQRALLRQRKTQSTLSTDEAYQLEKYAELKVGDAQDTGGGFFVTPNPQDADITARLQQSSSSSQSSDKPLLDDTRENVCDECGERFSNSFLLSNFDEKICDICKDTRTRHRLITKTEAKNEYLLTDADLELRDPPLRCLLRRNPREYARGYMKLYLRMQVEERALAVWQTEERLEAEREIRETKRESRKRKCFAKQLKQLRMTTRSSCFQRRRTEEHEHEFGEEQPYENADDPDGEYFRAVCDTCGFEKTYEKM